MKSLNREKMKKEIYKQVLLDEYEFSVDVCKRLRKDLIDVLKNYAEFDCSKLELNVKADLEFKLMIEVKCVVDRFILRCNNLQK